MTGRAADPAVSWRVLRAEIEVRLAAAGVEPADREATWLVEEASGLRGVDLEAGATTEQSLRLEAMVDRRAAGEPLQYVFGHWPFRSLDLMVDRRVLIPRPETEQVAEVALAELDRIVNHHRTAPALVADLGTGTGALAFTVAHERPATSVWAVECDADALAVARINRSALGPAVRRVQLVHGSWFDPLPEELRGQLDLVVSNPPYVGTDEVLPDSVSDWEPARALYAGPDGLDAIAEIVAGAVEWLAPHGVLVVEIGATQAAAATELAGQAGFTEVEVHPDLAGLDRALVARRAKSEALTSGIGSPRRSR